MANMALTEQEEFELLSLEREKSMQQTQEQPQQENQLERTISQRPDIYGQASQAVQNLPSNVMQQPGYNQVTRPFGMANFIPDIALKSFGGIAQRAESAIFNPFLRKQGKFQNPITAIKEGITGEQRGELGDVARQAGVPEPIAAGLGLVGTGIIGGALSKAAGLTSKATNLMKLETTYGKDIARNVIRQTTELPMPLVERGMQRGWRNILTKSNAREIDLPTKISSYVINSLDDITQKEYNKFGKVLDRVKTGNVKAIDLNQVIEDTLKQGGYIDETYNQTLKSRGPVVNKIQKFIDTATRNKVKPDTNIPIDVIQTFKNILKGFVPERNWIGKTRSLRGEQRLAKDLSNNLDNLIAYNSYGIEDEIYTQAKRNYSQFKNFEKAIMDNFAEVVGQEVKPTADKVVGISKIHPTKMLEEINKLYNIDSFLKEKGYQPIADKLLDWMTTQELLAKPQGGFFQHLYEMPIKYGVRQFLQGGLPNSQTSIATGIGKNTGEMVNRTNLIPASVLKIIQKRNQ